MKHLKIVRVKRGSKIPIRATPYSAGLDLFSCEKRIIKAKDRLLINTGLKIALPSQTYGRIAARSGLSINNHIDIGGSKKQSF
jgi:dUTP pyrophosphatase